MGMHNFKIAIAGHVIEVISDFRFSHVFFDKFLTDCKADLKIEITYENVDDLKIFHNPYQDSLSGWKGEMDFSVIQRLIAEKLINHEIFLMHGAAIAVDNNAIIFSGKSGIGKTTHMMKWMEQCPNTTVINGDKPFIQTGNIPSVYSSPWAGKESIYTITNAPLKAILFLERSENNHIQRISFSEAFPFLYQQTFWPDDLTKQCKSIAMLRSLEDKVSFYKFQINNFKDDCFQIAYNAIFS